MSRRAFLRWLFAFIAVAAASVSGIGAILKRVSKPAGTVQEPSIPAVHARGKTPLCTLLILSDLHINPDIPDRSRHLRMALDEIPAFGGVDGIVFTGDMTDVGRDADYKELHTVLKKYPNLPPYTANMGNHEYYSVWIDKHGTWNKGTFPNGRTDALSRQAFLRFFHLRKPYSSFKVQGYTVLMLSQEVYVQEKPDVGEGAWYSDEQLDWLRDQLKAEGNSGKPVFVMIHQPLPPEGQDGGNHQLIRAKEFRGILEPYRNVFVFSGHTHQDFLNGRSHYVRESFHWFQNSSVGRVINSNDQNAAAARAQGILVQIFEDRVTVRGREFEKKMWLPEANWSIPLAIPVKA